MPISISELNYLTDVKFSLKKKEKLYHEYENYKNLRGYKYTNHILIAQGIFTKIQMFISNNNRENHHYPNA